MTIQRWWCDLYWWNVKDQYSLPPSQFQWKGVFVWGFGFNYPSFSLAMQFNFGELHTREINQTGETWECDPAHALCLITPSHYVFVFTSMASLPRLFPYFVYFAPIVFRGIVSMLIPAEIWGRRWGRITEGAICGSSSYQHHHQYRHFNHNIISIFIILRGAIKIRTWNLKSSRSPKNCEEVCF